MIISALKKIISYFSTPTLTPPHPRTPQEPPPPTPSSPTTPSLPPPTPHPSSASHAAQFSQFDSFVNSPPLLERVSFFSDGNNQYDGNRPSSLRTVQGKLGLYVMGSTIGKGTFAVVREALNIRTLSFVAIKELDVNDLRRTPGGRENVYREIALHRRVSHHANIVSLVDTAYDLNKMKMRMVMEIGNGATLDCLLNSAPGKRLCESQVANFALQALRGLSFMHRHGVVHRDIKPANMMVNVDGTLKIFDFGVAESLDPYTQHDIVTRTSGSPAFQAPEIAAGELGYSGTKLDVWALGVSVYMLLSGQVPFDGSNVLHLYRNIVVGKYQDLENVSLECRDVVSQMLTLAWRDRPSVDALLQHPWIKRASRGASPAKKAEEGWVDVPRRQFKILTKVHELI